MRTNTTITAPSGIADGDLLLLIMATLDATEAPDPTPPSGFALMSGPTWPIEVSEYGLNLENRFYEKIAASESGDYTVIHANCSSQGVIVRITDPGDLSPVMTTNTGVDTTATALGFTTTVPDTLVLIVTQDFMDNANDLTPPTGTTPTFTERLDGATSLYFIASGLLATPTATGNKSMAVKNTDPLSPFTAYLIGIEPFVAPPSAPTITFKGGGHTRAGLEWTAGADGGSPVTDWDIDAAPESAPTSWLGVQATSSTLLYGAYTGLTNGTPYVFRVRGVNTAGDGAWSATSTAATPSDVRGFFLLENGDKFLLEDGTDKFLLESGAGAAAAAGPSRRHRPSQLLYR